MVICHNKKFPLALSNQNPSPGGSTLFFLLTSPAKKIIANGHLRNLAVNCHHGGHNVFYHAGNIGNTCSHCRIRLHRDHRFLGYPFQLADGFLADCPAAFLCPIPAYSLENRCRHHAHNHRCRNQKRQLFPGSSLFYFIFPRIRMVAVLLCLHQVDFRCRCGIFVHMTPLSFCNTGRPKERPN